MIHSLVHISKANTVPLEFICRPHNRQKKFLIDPASGVCINESSKSPTGINKATCQVTALIHKVITLCEKIYLSHKSCSRTWNKFISIKSSLNVSMKLFQILNCLAGTTKHISFCNSAGTTTRAHLQLKVFPSMIPEIKMNSKLYSQ